MARGKVMSPKRAAASGVKRVKTITLPLELHPAQAQIDRCPARFLVVIAGRRFGKTKYALYWLLKHAAIPGSVCWLVAPTFRQAKEIAWRELLALTPLEIVKSTNYSELSLTLKNGSMVSLKGSENRDGLRGKKVNALVMDEAAFQQSDVWSEILRPSLADTQGPALFITTPRGKNWVYHLWGKAQQKLDPDWASFRFSIHDNPYISRQEIEKIKASPEISEAVWRQEFMAEVLENVGQVYGEFEDAKNLFVPGQDFQEHTKWECLVGIDWGMGDDTAGAWLHVDPQSGVIVMSREHSQNGWSISRQTEVLKAMSFGLQIPETNWVIDQSAFQTDGTSGTSVARMFRKEGIPVVPGPSRVDPSMSVVKRFLLGSSGKPWFYVAANCVKTIEAFRTWEYDQHEPDILAAIRYALHAIYRHRLTPLALGDEDLLAKNSEETSRVNQPPRKAIRHPEAQGWDYEYAIPAEEW